MEREEMIKQLMWNSGGTGYGICSFANMVMQNMMEPKSPEEDWISIVAIQRPSEKYTDKELEKLLTFSKEETEKYDKFFRWRMGCNLIFIGKVEEGIWLRKKQSWRDGPMYSKSLDEALQVMRKG